MKLTPATVVRRLMPLHGPVELPRRLDPLGELVFTILSQSTADTNSMPAYQNLVARFDGDWDGVRRARVATITTAIRRAGLANQKAPRIKALLNRLHREHGKLSLNHLKTMSDAEAVEYLTSFDGVGRKTAACVLMFACRRPVLPVDTHVHRISQRLGLIEKTVTPTAAHDLLQRQLKPQHVLDFHVLLIRHGRTVCRALRPRCHTCPLLTHCPAAPQLINKGLVAPEETPLTTPAKATPHVPPSTSRPKKRARR